MGVYPQNSTEIEILHPVKLKWQTLQMTCSCMEFCGVLYGILWNCKSLHMIAQNSAKHNRNSAPSQLKLQWQNLHAVGWSSECSFVEFCEILWDSDNWEITILVYNVAVYNDIMRAVL